MERFTSTGHSMTTFRSRFARVFALAVSCGAADAAAGQTDYAALRSDRRLQAVRTPTPLTIDGALDEAAWRDAPAASQFLQNEPREGEPASEATEVRILYDDTYLYLGVQAYDRSPKDLIVSDLKKDFDPSASDSFEFVLDTFRDERNGYNDRRDSTTGDFTDRALVAKMTYLFAF